MTTTDISPEAVERLACILEGRGGFVKDGTITLPEWLPLDKGLI